MAEEDMYGYPTWMQALPKRPWDMQAPSSYNIADANALAFLLSQAGAGQSQSPAQPPMPQQQPFNPQPNASPNSKPYDPGFPGSGLFGSQGMPSGAQKTDKASDPAFAWLSQYMPWNRQPLPSGAPPQGAMPGTPGGVPGSPGGVPGTPGGLPGGMMRPPGKPGSPTGFMDTRPPQGGAALGFEGGKRQDRLSSFGGLAPGVKGDMWQPPSGGTSPASPPGAGAASGGAAPTPSGPMLFDQVMFSLIEANKDKLKTKEGRIILGMAAMQFMPLMQKEEQIKAKAIQQQLTNEIQMMKLQQGESKLELQAERLDAYRDKLASGKTVKDETQKEYDAIATRADRLAQHLAQTPGDKILKQRYDDTIAQLNTFKERITPTAPSKKYGDWLTSTIAKPDADLQIAGSIPPDVKSKLSPEDLAALIDRLKKNPLEGYARIDWLRNRLRGGETTIGKTNEYYR